jgi:hypothetical protein
LVAAEGLQWVKNIYFWFYLFGTSHAALLLSKTIVFQYEIKKKLSRRILSPSPYQLDAGGHFKWHSAKTALIRRSGHDLAWAS